MSTAQHLLRTVILVTCMHEGGLHQSADDGRSQTGPKMYRSEDGGFYIDPATVSKSPIKTFTRIGDLDPKESDMYYNQFSRKSKRKSRTDQRQSEPYAVVSNWGRPEFDDLLPGQHYSCCMPYSTVWI